MHSSCSGHLERYSTANVSHSLFLCLVSENVVSFSGYLSLALVLQVLHAPQSITPIIDFYYTLESSHTPTQILHSETCKYPIKTRGLHSLL